MERRNRSLEALKALRSVDSLEDDSRANAIQLWYDEYLNNNSIKNFDLELPELEILSELFFKNINFLKNHRQDIREELVKNNNIKKFLR